MSSTTSSAPTENKRSKLEDWAEVVGHEVIDQLHQLAAPLRGKKVVHINSTKKGGGVAEILEQMIPAMCDMGIDASWDVITGDDEFYQTTKSFHNGLQGNSVDIPDRLLQKHIDVNRQNLEKLRDPLKDADIVFIHDPQPAPLLSLLPERKGKWIWRCHIDVSKPHRPVWKHIRKLVTDYDASIFSLATFAQRLPHAQYLIPPSIDPLSEKNRDLDPQFIDETRQKFDLDPDLPLLVQVSRYDWFKDPVGVIKAYKLIKRRIPSQLVLAGGEATDDPEGAEVLEKVREEAGDDKNIHVLLLPSDAHKTINALQRAANIILQKSTREGFGLTVTEAMWKGKPVIGGNTGGITLQVTDYHTGFLVDTPEGAAFRIRYLLNRPNMVNRMGTTAKRFVKDHFLLTRHLRDYLTLMISLTKQSGDVIYL